MSSCVWDRKNCFRVAGEFSSLACQSFCHFWLCSVWETWALYVAQTHNLSLWSLSWVCHWSASSLPLCHFSSLREAFSTHLSQPPGNSHQRCRCRFLHQILSSLFLHLLVGGSYVFQFKSFSHHILLSAVDSHHSDIFLSFQIWVFKWFLLFLGVSPFPEGTLALITNENWYGGFVVLFQSCLVSIALGFLNFCLYIFREGGPRNLGRGCHRELAPRWRPPHKDGRTEKLEFIALCFPGNFQGSLGGKSGWE